MKPTSVETVIVGAGISGLACANKLYSAGKDFVIVSKDVGGRIKVSKKDPRINFGGVYINKDYFNLMPHVDIVEIFRVRDFAFFNGKTFKTIFSVSNLKYYPKIIRFVFLLRRFRNRLNVMRKLAENEELRTVIARDPLLKKYWEMPVTIFLKENNFEDIDYLFGQPTSGTNFFTTSSELNTFYYLFLFISMIRPSYIVDLSKTTQRLSSRFESKLILGEVVAIKKQKNGSFVISTKKMQFHASNVVVAAPYLDVKAAHPLPKPGKTTSVYTFYVRGIRKKEFSSAKGIVLHPKFHDAYLLWRQLSGGDIIYSKVANLDLSKYYDSFTVVEKVYWKTAAHLPGKQLIPQNLDDGLYLASDYNYSLMEDAFITGLYAANQIISKK